MTTEEFLEQLKNKLSTLIKVIDEYCLDAEFEGIDIYLESIKDANHFLKEIEEKLSTIE
jgi:hypothetical protein